MEGKGEDGGEGKGRDLFLLSGPCFLYSFQKKKKSFFSMESNSPKTKMTLCYLFWLASSLPLLLLIRDYFSVLRSFFLSPFAKPNRTDRTPKGDRYWDNYQILCTEEKGLDYNTLFFDNLLLSFSLSFDVSLPLPLQLFSTSLHDLFIFLIVERSFSLFSRFFFSFRNFIVFDTSNDCFLFILVVDFLGLGSVLGLLMFGSRRDFEFGYKKSVQIVGMRLQKTRWKNVGESKK